MRVTLKILFAFLLLLFVTAPAHSQASFDDEVRKLVQQDTALSFEPLVLFTGSSSIRLWHNMADYFPQYTILNRGFGGSQMTDLLHHFDQLILPYNSQMIVIYEGDNDITAGKTSAHILATADSLLESIRTRASQIIPVAFITPKPSIARWHLKEKYEEYNRALKKWAHHHPNVYVIDVWRPMLLSNRQVRHDIFVDDGLHMNQKGYAIWAKAIRPYLKKAIRKSFVSRE